MVDRHVLLPVSRPLTCHLFAQTSLHRALQCASGSPAWQYAQMSGIFISYRREDAAADAGRLYDDLRRRHTSEVFLDLSMRAGVDFHEALFARIESCDVLLALIGPRWLQARNEVTGERRLDEEND